MIGLLARYPDVASSSVLRVETRPVVSASSGSAPSRPGSSTTEACGPSRTWWPREPSTERSAGINSLFFQRRRRDRLNLTRGQRVGLDHFEDFNLRIPRGEIEKIEDLLLKTIKGVDAKFDVTVCGSYRRGLDTSADVDVLIAHDNVGKREGRQGGPTLMCFAFSISTRRRGASTTSG